MQLAIKDKVFKTREQGYLDEKETQRVKYE
jgi:hypothetical protein